MSDSPDLRNLVGGIAGIAAVSYLFRELPQLSNATTAAFGFLIVVLLVAATARLWVAVATSIAAMLAFNFYFLPPVGSLTIVDPQNWIALVAFLAVSLVATNLSAVARDRTRQAVTRRDELGRLFALSRDILLITDSRESNSSLAGFISRRFDLDYVGVCVPSGAEWLTFEAGSLELALDHHELSTAYARARQGRDADAGVKSVESTLTVGAHLARLLPLRLGARSIGLLAVAGRPIESGTFDALAGIAAIAIERAQFLEERRLAELSRQSEELKSALLASLGHDLRTPLTAIRVAASNLQASWLNETERREQTEVIVVEVDRLTRLFSNILEMARIDAGAVSPETRWVAPTEIVEAARTRVEPSLRGHAVDVSFDAEQLVRLDPRLTAAALSHLLENSAQYSPSGSPIHVHANVSEQGLRITVRDHGSGIRPSDLPHVFDRFFRGADTTRGRSGTGMGLAIARGLLAVERGQIAAENCTDGGAQFTILVPAEVK
jgi:two-component system, OmpR family, sensor histidine kinase KdpD